jgi:ABC-type branched-subunit amino acid transport system substrate-binding protein
LKNYQRGFKFVFTPFMPARKFSESFFQMLGTLNPKRVTVAFIREDLRPFPTESDEAIVNANKLGFKVVLKEDVEQNAKDVTPTLLKAKSANADVMVIHAFDTVSGAPPVR